jgi:hypothetical protein
LLATKLGTEERNLIFAKEKEAWEIITFIIAGLFRNRKKHKMLWNSYYPF